MHIGTIFTALDQSLTVHRPTGAIIAYKNPSIQVTIADQNAERIEAWKSNKLPIYEPGLDHIVSTARDGVVSPLIQPADSGNGGNPVTDRGDCNEEILGSLDLGHTPNLFFTTDVTSAIAKADLIFVCVNTPTKKSGIGKDHACDLKYFEAATRKIAEAATSDKIIVEKSTVPCRTAQRMREIVSGAHQNLRESLYEERIRGEIFPSDIQKRANTDSPAYSLKPTVTQGSSLKSSPTQSFRPKVLRCLIYSILTVYSLGRTQALRELTLQRVCHIYTPGYLATVLSS
jgi:hypothetical protein